MAATKPGLQKTSVAAEEKSRPAADGYLGSAACSQCHADIYRTFTKTRMGRSLSPVTPATIQSLPLPAKFYSAKIDRHFEVFSRNGKLFQSEFETAPDGSEVFRNTQQIEWIVGAGISGYNGLVKRGNYLFEAPLAYYSNIKRWELSPGYESSDLGFNRPILAGCISCHSGRPRPAEQATGKFEPVPFSQNAIGCENCHGPGEAHVHAMATHTAAAHGSQIVNPDRLSADLENNICMRCHEAGDSRVPLPGKDFKDIRPGVPLADTMAVLMVPPKREDTDDSAHVQHYFQMTMSKCYRATAGQLRCTTCHDPHIEPTATEAPAYFNAKCQGCHASRACTAPIATRHATTPADNCIGCHMPRRADGVTAHTSLTNHRIVAREGEPWPDNAFQLTTPSLPDLVYVDRPPGDTEPPPAPALLEAYREISERKPEYRASYLKLLGELETSDPSDARVQEGAGYRDLQSGAIEQAIGHLQRSIALEPRSALAYVYLSDALAQRGQLDEAIRASEKAVQLEPYKALFQKALIDRLVTAKQYDKALTGMEHYLEVFPEDTEMRRMLEMVKK